MRIFAGVIAGLLFLAVSTQVWAAEVIRLGFFDKQAIVDRSEMGKEGLEKLRAKMVPIREKLDAARQEIEELEAEFKKKELVWSNDVKQAKFQEIRAKKVMLRQGVDQANRILIRARAGTLDATSEKCGRNRGSNWQRRGLCNDL